MIVEFMAEAEQELVDAVLWYESKQTGLGRRFRIEVETVARSISSNPLLHRERDGGYRRINCPIFPYYLPYFIRHEKIIVAAVAHEHRKPSYWSQRQKGD
jgi:plasmid stabilization system protein ParE